MHIQMGTIYTGNGRNSTVSIRLSTDHSHVVQTYRIGLVLQPVRIHVCMQRRVRSTLRLLLYVNIFTSTLAIHEWL